MFTITNTSRDDLTPNDGTFHTDNTGWSHTRWHYTITGTESGRTYTSTYRAGIALRYASAEELRTAILECLTRDIDDATDQGMSRPDVRSLIAQISEEYGEDDPLEAYDTAVALYELSRWYWDLTTNEQAHLATYREL